MLSQKDHSASTPSSPSARGPRARVTHGGRPGRSARVGHWRDVRSDCWSGPFFIRPGAGAGAGAGHAVTVAVAVYKLQVQTVLPFKQHVLETAKRPFPLVRLGLRVLKKESDA